jgi:cell division septal protein FtsQ
MWFTRKIKNRRAGRTQNVLDVKMRSSQIRAARTRLAGITLALGVGTLLVLYLVWRSGEWALNRLVYDNKSFSIQKVEVLTDGVISPDQLRRWGGVKPGENLLALDLARVKRDLELVPAVQSVSVERILPGTLRIRVAERVPVAQIHVPHPRSGGGIEIVLFEIDSEGCVMLPLDPRQRAVPLNVADGQLPVLSGIYVSDLQPGRKVESAQVRAALQWIEAFESSPMAGLVDLKSLDVSTADVLGITTGQGSTITFGLINFEQQLSRWQAVHELGIKMNKVIATLDLAVSNNVAARWLEASTVPPSPRQDARPQRTRRKNV